MSRSTHTLTTRNKSKLQNYKIAVRTGSAQWAQLMHYCIEILNKYVVYTIVRYMYVCIWIVEHTYLLGEQLS